MAWRSTEGHIRDVGGSNLQLSRSGIKCDLRRSFTTREAEISAHDIDPYMFPRKQISIKSMFSTENVKKVEKPLQNSSTIMQYYSMQLIVVLITRP